MNIISVLLTNIVSNKYTKYGIIGIILLLGYWYHQWQVDNAYDNGYKKATDELTTQYHQRELEIQAQLDELALKHQQEVNGLRQSFELQQQKYMDEYERGKQDAENNANRVIAKLRNDNKRLSIETRSQRKTSACVGASSTTNPTTDTFERTELSEHAARFLIRQATDADNVVRELNLCKQTLWNTRELVDEYNKTLNK